MDNDGRITVVINTYNAEKFLQRVLDSVKGFDEILICDMESTDSTQDIARRNGCRIVIFPKGKTTIVEPARTFAVQSARTQWVLVVDADELVTPELHDYLYARIKKSDCPQGLYIPRRNRFMNIPEKGRAHDYQLRFFIREGTTWPEYIHSVPTINGRVEKIPNSLHNVELAHLAENFISEIIEKSNRYTDYEVEKRLSKHYGLWALLWRPVWCAFRLYVFKGAFRNGIKGFIDAGINYICEFILIAKIIEKRYKDRS